jgi:hypothetical protein
MHAIDFELVLLRLATRHGMIFENQDAGVGTPEMAVSVSGAQARNASAHHHQVKVTCVLRVAESGLAVAVVAQPMRRLHNGPGIPVGSGIVADSAISGESIRSGCSRWRRQSAAGSEQAAIQKIPPADGCIETQRTPLLIIHWSILRGFNRNNGYSRLRLGICQTPTSLQKHHLFETASPRCPVIVCGRLALRETFAAPSDSRSACCLTYNDIRAMYCGVADKGTISPDVADKHMQQPRVSEHLNIDDTADASSGEALQETHRLEDTERYRTNPGPLIPPQQSVVAP